MARARVVPQTSVIEARLVVSRTGLVTVRETAERASNAPGWAATLAVGRLGLIQGLFTVHGGRFNTGVSVLLSPARRNIRASSAS